ncbi:MAG: fused MFS/spermidine synthase [Myxococcota bacterium]
MSDRLLFALAVTCSAFLVFLVQPMVGKRLLPWYGGAPGVWALCLAFYQTTLFAGYAYAYLLVRIGRPGLELGLHAVLFAAALFALPVLPGEAFRPEAGSDATSGILFALVSNVALPFLFLAATGPLVQTWFARARPASAPYFLYALSNAGSLLALFAYPFLFEPNLGLAETGSTWALGFAVVGTAVLGCGAVAVARGGSRKTSDTDASQVEPPETRIRDIALWMTLSGVAVVLLMGITNQLCLDVASVPFLWILPLAVYLVTFILCFASERFYRRGPLVSLAAITVLLLPFAEPAFNHEASFAALQSRPVAIGLYLLLLFASCMVLHGELYRRRPAVQTLTLYYLWVSAGGALGGLFVGIVAERWFVDYYEVPAGFAVWWILVLALAMRDTRGVLGRGAPLWRKAAASAAAAFVLLSMFSGERFRTDGVVHQERSFFGVLRVITSKVGSGPAYVLRHGTTLHGVQLRSVNFRPIPTAYYGYAGGIGLTLEGVGRSGPIRVGIIGLGVGTLAAYGRPGDLYRFYEVDPAVISLARNSEFFTFLGDSGAEIDVVEADGRLALEDEQRRGEPGWDVLVVDAFSSDAVPVHLLTREAFELYVRRLAPGGVIAIHVSNRHLALTELSFRQARSSGLAAAELRTASAPMLTTLRSRWVVLVRESERLERLLSSVASATRSLRLPRDHVSIDLPGPSLSDEVPVWTDDYSDLLSILSPPRS